MTAESAADGQAPRSGLLIDWGGVLTSPIPDVVRSWLVADEIDHDSYTAVLRPWLRGAYTPDGETLRLALAPGVTPYASLLPDAPAGARTYGLYRLEILAAAVNAVLEKSVPEMNRMLGERGVGRIDGGKPIP